LTDLLSDHGTRTSAATSVPVTPPRTRTIDDLVEEVGYNRNVARVLGEDIVEVGRQLGQLHHRAYNAQLNTRARDIARRPQAAILEEIANHGFAWRAIARMLGVSVPALRRWRHGEPATGEHLLSMARLLAVVEILRENHLVANVAAWMEMPLVPGPPLTGGRPRSVRPAYGPAGPGRAANAPRRRTGRLAAGLERALPLRLRSVPGPRRGFGHPPSGS